MIDAKLKSEGKPWDYVYTVTGKDYEGPAYETFANMPENKDMVNGLILEITNSRNGSRKGSRKGRTIEYANRTYNVSDIDRYIAEGNVKKVLQIICKVRL